MAIPQSSPLASYLAQRDEIDAAVLRVLASGRYVLGEEVAAFEREFAAFSGASHAIGVGSGTDALHLALRAAGIGQDDVVVTVANSAVATAAAIGAAGARLAFADVDPVTLAMSAGSLDALLGACRERVRAVVPVHLYGRCAAMEEIESVAKRHGLLVIEDCAQAHGATRGGRAAGTSGDIAAFSFYPTKNLGAFGDGGAIVTSNPAFAERAHLLRQYGWRERDDSSMPGFNSRLDEVQAAILRVKLRALRAGNERRRAIAAAYDAQLRGCVTTPPSEAGHVYHQYVVRSNARDRLRDALARAAIQTLVHYPTPIHLQNAYAGRVILPPGGLPVTEAAAHEILSLPMFPELRDEDVAKICAAIREAAD